MKTVLLRIAFPLALLAASCGNTAENQETAHEHNAAAGPVTAEELKHMDPVCQMVNDGTWTDYTVYNEDTVYFCSETCKDAFVANPGKYVQQ
jgi:YHS domain-containing protein